MAGGRMRVPPNRPSRPRRRVPMRRRRRPRIRTAEPERQATG